MSGLFGNQEVVIFLAALNDQVPAIDQVIGAYSPFGVRDFRFVERYAATLDHFADFSFRRENRSGDGQQFLNGHAYFKPGF